MDTITDTHSDHDIIDPAILYFGTPVVLLTTVAADGTTNVAPMSSVFWLGKTAMLGMGGRSQTARNLLQTGECVLNLPSVGQAAAVDRLALTTGVREVPGPKADIGYAYEPDKFQRAGLTPIPATSGRAPRVRECPVHLEGRVVSHHALCETDPDATETFVFEVAIEVVHVLPSIRQLGTENRIDPDLWQPLLMSFQNFYGLGSQVHPSRLFTIDEEWYR